MKKVILIVTKDLKYLTESEKVQNLIKQVLVRTCSTPWTATVFIARKKNYSLRLLIVVHNVCACFGECKNISRLVAGWLQIPISFLQAVNGDSPGL